MRSEIRWGKAFAFALGLTATVNFASTPPMQVRTESGVVEGRVSADGKIRIFKGIPFAAPPTGDLRWQVPKPPLAWEGVRQTTDFGPHCMQGAIYKGMVFRDSGPSEDCLSLNVWTPADSADARLPVMVWIHGGGFQGGGSSVPSQDGEKLAHKGVVVVSLNYRLSIFGFFSHAQLTKESPHHASGNYGLLDQNAALQWIRRNIAGFGGDPSNVTIFGESAGSMSVSSHMASPLSQGLFQRGIGESGGVFMLEPRELVRRRLSDTEQQDAKFAESIGAPTLEALRTKPANELLRFALLEQLYRFWPNVDGYFFPEPAPAIYAAGKQAHVPLLAGWNSLEQPASALMGKEQPTPQNYEAKVRAVYGSHANEVLKLFPGKTENQAKESALDLAGDQFIAYSTWKWIEAQRETGASPVYAYHFEQVPPTTPGAYHSADIEYVFETLDSKDLPWTDDDRKLSDMISSYWTNFAKKGNPNGPGLPNWPRYEKRDDYKIMHLEEVEQRNAVNKTTSQLIPRASSLKLRRRYELLDRIARQRETTFVKP